MTDQQTAVMFETVTGRELREAQRLEAIQRWRVLDVPPDAFRPITALAAKVFGVPYGTVCIIDGERVWFKDPHGITIESIPARPGLCCSVVDTGRSLFLPDAREHAESRTHPLVAGEFGLRFYSGVPLRTADGIHVGTLAVFDQEVRSISDQQRAMLTDLADVVVREVEVRLAALTEVASEKEETDSERARATNLEHAMGTHGIIGQAIGILMAQRRYTSQEGFAALRVVSQRNNVKLVDVARRLVEDFDSRMAERER
jgi:GAF domain-containing protein